MTSIHVNPDHNVTALVDPYDEESGSELSEHGRQVVEEKLRAIGYGHVTFIASHEMAQHVNAYPGGRWYQEGAQPREGWSFFDAPDAEVLVDEAGIDFTDPEMWA